MFKHLSPLFEWKSTGMSWHVPFLAALGVGIPVFLGLWLGQPRQSMLAATGAMVILYLPPASFPMAARMRRLIRCGAGFAICYVAAALSAFHPAAAIPSLGILTLLSTVVCRWNRVPPPGSFFFVVIAAIASNARFHPEAIPANAAWVLFGSAVSCLLAFVYLLFQSRAAGPAVSTQAISHDANLPAILVEASIIATFVGLSLFIARLLDLENPYWVPISCAAILQGGTFRAVWHRNVHRIVGTALGMGLSWFLFPSIPHPMALAVIMVCLVFVVEVLVSRNYGLAVIFITPMTVCFAEFTSGGVPIHDLFAVRLLDITLGSVIGAIGGTVLHHPDWCRKMEGHLRHLCPVFR